MRTVFKSNPEVTEAKGWIPYWQIADILGVHEQTLRNWMKKEMSQERKKAVLSAIETIKKEMKSVY